MTNIKNNSVYMLLFGYSLFSFAVSVPSFSFTVWDWIVLILFNGFIYVMIALFIFDGKENKPLTDLFALIYILVLISRQIYIMNSYMVIYHRQSSDLWNFTATFILLFVLSSLPNIRINKLALPVSLLVFILVARAIVLNIKKVNPINLYSTRILGKAGDYNITLFDYIIPLNIICRDNLSCSRKNVISFIILQFFTEIMLSIYAFSCLKGNLLYSISPLQMLFRISNGVLIDNFDAIFNLLLYFAYFSAIIVLMYAYNRIKQRFLYIGKYDLLLVPVFMIVIPIITADVWFVLQVLIAAIIFTGGKKVRVGCND